MLCEAPINFLRLLAIDVLWSLTQNYHFYPGVQAVTCYCTYAECNAAFCEGDYCLVGFRKENDRGNDYGGKSIYAGQIFQQCTSAEIGKEIAGPCRSDFLSLWEDVCKCTSKNCNTYAYYRRAMDAYNQVQHSDQDFQAPPGDEELTGVAPHDAVGFSNSQLIILLICVPLGVGVVAVVFVFINYHWLSDSGAASLHHPTTGKL